MKRSVVSLITVPLFLAGCGGGAGTADPVASADRAQIAAIAQRAMDQYHLKALILRVMVDGQPLYSEALGESLPGVPATAGMHVRNGFIAYSYLTTVLLELVDRGQIHLDDTLAQYFPDLPRADAVTIKMFANSTSGYADYVYQPEVADSVDVNPSRQWATDELIRIGTSAPALFAPGTNWGYSHTNYAILGEVLEKAGHMPLGQLMQRDIFEPMGLQQTTGSDTPAIPEPVLHTYSSERRATLGIPPGAPFYEDSTYWSPSWTAPAGALQTTDVADLTASIAAIGSGELLSPQSHDLQVGPHLVGFGHTPADGSCNVCRENTPSFSFGLGVVLLGPWITGNKFFAGSGAAVGYLPARKLAIAVITTYLPEAFDATSGRVSDAGPWIMAAVTAALAPDQPIPAPAPRPGS